MKPRVLRVSRLDASETSYILLHITSAGTQALDCSFVATEGENGYSAETKHDAIAELRTSSSRISEEEWRIALLWVLFANVPSPKHQNFIDQIELSASLTGSHLILNIRQTISEIAHRLGSIELLRQEEPDIELFDWAAIAATTTAEAERQATTVRRQIDSQNAELERLKQLNEELVQVKLQHEKEMLERFRQLLNAKKLKIRDQQRLLSSAKVDPSLATKVGRARNARSPGKDTVAAKSRGRRTVKRPASPPPAASSDEDGDTDDLESSRDNVEREQQTPDHSDTNDDDGASEGYEQTSMNDTNSPTQLEVPGNSRDRSSIPIRGSVGTAGKPAPSFHDRAMAHDPEADETDDEL